MVRYMFTWILIAAVIYGFRYLLTKKEVLATKGVGKRIALSCSIAGVVVVILYFLNNIQGI